MSNDNGYAWLLAYGLIFVGILVLIRTQVGYVLVYWFLIISIVVILAVNSPTIVELFGSVWGPGAMRNSQGNLNTGQGT